ncbi:MAG TPA: hypothetical protein RMG95_00250 [Polyangiaceae bacterium LLY-WYZ-15_(1-7)]|nr:hypothetical protein [Polyangiaceae bacterium LLY-WYZ-15_(1-7)]
MDRELVPPGEALDGEPIAFLDLVEATPGLLGASGLVRAAPAELPEAALQEAFEALLLTEPAGPVLPAFFVVVCRVARRVDALVGAREGGDIDQRGTAVSCFGPARDEVELQQGEVHEALEDLGGVRPQGGVVVADRAKANGRLRHEWDARRADVGEKGLPGRLPLRIRAGAARALDLEERANGGLLVRGRTERLRHGTRDDPASVWSAVDGDGDVRPAAARSLGLDVESSRGRGRA